MANEYELKFLAVDEDATRQLFAENGFELSKPKKLMRRQTYHLPKDHPEHESKWGRVRDEGDQITATIKWYATPDTPSISDVHEEEITVKDWDEGVAWVEARGFTPTAYQENTREAWRKPDVEGLEVTIDIWPGLKPYIEIEANSVDQVNSVARELGYDPANGIAGGTEVVYQLEAGIPAQDIKRMPTITFAAPPKKP